jgi:RimJ/RimL family protein N-acetyltransferase
MLRLLRWKRTRNLSRLWPRFEQRLHRVSVEPKPPPMTDLSTWTKREAPGVVALTDKRVRLEPLDWNAHGPGLFAAVGGQHREELWRHMPVGPFGDEAALEGFLAYMRKTEGWRTMVVRQTGTGDVLGMATYMRIREAHGSAEIGCVAFGDRLRRTPEGTEGLAVMAGHVMDDLGYRRYEWKCNSANEASKRAAERFGFTFEGVFRNDMVTKGKSRDTAWYSIIDAEWPAIRAALEQWLAPGNFGPDGGQTRTLESFRGLR